jgi:hypothetical protein
MVRLSPKTAAPDHAGITWGRCMARSPEGLQSEAKLCPSVFRFSQRCCAQCDQDHDICETMAAPAASFEGSSLASQPGPM